MKRLPFRLTILGFGAFAIFSLFAVKTIHSHFRSQPEPSLVAQSQVAGTKPIVPAPQPRSESKQKIATNSPIISSAQTTNSDLALLYDEKMSFEANLGRLKEFCQSHEKDTKLTLYLNEILNEFSKEFVKSLLEHAKGEFVVVKKAIEQVNGTTTYRNLLLACVMAADAPSPEKADLVWKVALDKNEQIGVRRTATFLTIKVEDIKKRPGDVFALLADPDSEIVISALANSTRHLDENSYNLIKSSLINSPDINLRVAAVSALGRANFPDSQVTLREIVSSGQTTKEDAFSEATLPKRAAIPHLDMRNPETYELVKQTALNENEDPGVRAKAISRFTPASFPEATEMLLQLLRSLDADNTVPLRAVVDTLLTSATPQRIQAIRTRADELSDPQVRTLILKRIELATKGEKP